MLTRATCGDAVKREAMNAMNGTAGRAAAPHGRNLSSPPARRACNGAALPALRAHVRGVAAAAAIHDSPLCCHCGVACTSLSPTHAWMCYAVLQPQTIDAHSLYEALRDVVLFWPGAPDEPALRRAAAFFGTHE